MPIYGEGKKGILIVLESPSKSEDEHGSPYAGEGGRLVLDAFKACGINVRTDCWTTYATICHSKAKKGPTEEQIGYCRPNITKALKELNPSVVIPFGRAAMVSIVSPLWKDDLGTAQRWAGVQIPSRKTNRWICPTYASGDVLMRKDRMRTLEMFFRRYIAAACALGGTYPWPNGAPKYDDTLELITDANLAAVAISEMNASGKPTAFDYEGNCLKPEYEGAKLKCASISDGERTIAFALNSKVVRIAFRAYLRNPKARKVAANMKFEDRFSRLLMKTQVRGWLHDTMLGGHALDSRKGTKSIKFQAFVTLGVEPWNTHIHELLESKEHEHLNRVDEIEIMQLLKYCALDSLYEMLVFFEQRKELNALQLKIAG